MWTACLLGQGLGVWSLSSCVEFDFPVVHSGGGRAEAEVERSQLGHRCWALETGYVCGLL